jgi:hypothetical protein
MAIRIDGSDSLHLPRICFATFWPLRVMCARNRLLVERTDLNEVWKNVWFSTEMLDKLFKLVGGEETDSLEIARRLMGHTSTFEFINDYCRSWPLQMKLAISAR